MKKVIVALLSLTLLIGSALPVSAANSPLASAKDGDVIYSFNFNGDSKFAPKAIKGFAANYEATPSADGKSIVIKSKAGASGEKGFWGGIIDGYTYAKTDVHNKYAFVYKIKTNGAANDKNRIAVGGYTKYFGEYTEVTGNTGKYSTDGSAEFGISVNDLIIWKDNPSVGISGFVKASELKKQLDVDSEGFLTMMVVYEGASDKCHTYALSKGGDPTKEADWIYMQWANLGLKETNYLGFLVFVNSNSVDVTIKDARIYKGLGYPKADTYTPGASGAGSGSAQTGDNMYLLLPVMFVAAAVFAGSMIAVRKTKRR